MRTTLGRWMLGPVRAATIALCSTFALWWLATPARADRVVRIRAETRIELDVRRGTELVVEGVLRDDAGHPLEMRRVDLSIRPEHGSVIASRALTTNETGTFAMTLPALSDVIVADAVFVGDADLEGSSVRVVVDQQRAHVVLVVTLDGGSRLSLDAPTHPILVTATSSAGGAGLRVTVRNEIGGEIAIGTTGDGGRWRGDLPSTALGPAAAGRLIVRSEADDTRAAAQTEVPIVRSRATHFVWLDDATELMDGTVLRGRLETSSGALERRAVGLYLNDRHLGTRLTGPAGEIAVPLEAALAADSSRDVRVEARFDADAPWLDSSRSEVRTLHVHATPKLVPWLAGATALLFLAAAAWLRRRPVDAAASRQLRTAGVSVTRTTTILATIREIGGVVLRASSDDPIVGAVVRVAEVSAHTDASGGFELTPPAGTHTLVIEAPGFDTIEQRVTCPHRGDLRGLTIRLASRRELASKALLDVLALVLPAEVAGAATDRELVALARRKRKTFGATEADLDALVRAIEPIVYGNAAPDHATLERVRALASAVRVKLARVDSASAASL